MSIKSTPAAAALLGTLKVGNSINIRVGTDVIAAKFSSYVPHAERFRATKAGGGILWVDVCNLIVDGEAAPVAPQPKNLPKAPVEPAAPRAAKGDYVNMEEADGHKWDKQNSFTLSEKKGGAMYDVWYCEVCGLTGKRYGLNAKLLITKAATKGVVECANKPVFSPLERGITHIRLLAIGSNNPAYSKLKVGEVYPVIEAPAMYANLRKDVWIPGVGDACRLFADEWEQVVAPAAVEPVESFVRVENAWSADMPNELRERMDNCAGREDFCRDVFSATVLAKEILEDFNEGGHHLNDMLNSRRKDEASEGKAIKKDVTQWLKKHGKDAPVEQVATELHITTPEPFVAAVEVAVEQLAQEAPERPKVAEFSQGILRALAAHGGPMLANDLAAAVGEGIRKVAASFTNLSKMGLIESHGGEDKKGGKMIELTAAGYEYVSPEQYVDKGEPTMEQAGEELAEAAFEPTPAHVEAMERVGDAREAGLEIMDIFTATLLQDLARHPYPLVVSESKAADSYGHAILTSEGVEYAKFLRGVLRMGERVVEAPVVAAKPARGRKPGSTAEVVAARRISGARTGRAGTSRQSLREQVLGEFSRLANGSLGYREAVAEVCSKHALTKAQVLNVAFKLVKGGFLVADAEGKVASPLALSERGAAGYSTNYGAKLRPLIEAAIAEGLDNKAIALRVQCDSAYVNDIRTGRVTGYAIYKNRRLAEKQAK